MGTGIVQALINAGHHVTICVLVEPEFIRPKHVPQLSEFKAANVSIVEIPVPAREPNRLSGWRRLMHRIRVLTRPSHTDFHPLAKQSHVLAETLTGIQPDVIVVFQVIEVLYGVQSAPKMALLGAMEHLTLLYWLRLQATWRTPIRTMMGCVRALLVRRWNIHMLGDYQRVGVLGAQDTVWLRRRGVTNALYLPAPIVDPGESLWKHRYQKRPSGTKWKIIMVGHVQALPTLSGLYFFAEHVLPRLEQVLDPETFEVHIIGRYLLPKKLAIDFARPSIRLRGFVEDIASEFLSADILLVPTPIDFSIRVRISVGFSFGCCVVAHQANAPGMAELIHDYNILMGADGESLVAQIVRALRDDVLRERLGCNARRTYEEHFSLEEAGKKLLKVLGEIAFDKAEGLTGPQAATGGNLSPSSKG